MGKVEAVDSIVQESVRKEDEDFIQFVKKQEELKRKEQEEEEVRKREF